MANTYSQIYIQIVFAVEARQYLIRRECKEELQKYITGIVTRQGQKLLAINSMPDHTHIIITPAINESTAKCIQYIKGGYSFAARQQCAGDIWHSGYHEHRIRDADDYNAQLF